MAPTSTKANGKISLPGRNPSDTSDLFYSHWRRLNAWLNEYQSLWRPVPFRDPEPAWTLRYPELSDWLDGLDGPQCDTYEQHPERLAARLRDWLPGLADYPALVAVPDLSPGQGKVDVMTLAERNAVDMPGRKRLQSGAFVAALAPLTGPSLDWCCGKGHLSRTLARQGRVPVTGYEWNGGLVEDGNRLVQRYGDAVTLQCRDVMASDLSWPDGAHGVALHACGDLHRKLIRDVVTRRQPRISFSPCCYHLTNSRHLTLLSERTRADANALALTRDDLRLAVQETVTAPIRDRKQSARTSQWRLGFDGLQRHLRGVDDYLPLPPHPKRLMGEGFEAFCHWAADRKGLTLPVGIDYGHWLDYGADRAARVRRYELVRHLFRRPLELWLVLDYGLFLEESGYEVRLGTFCDRTLTPRNLLVDAVITKKAPEGAL